MPQPLPRINVGMPVREWPPFREADLRRFSSRCAAALLEPEQQAQPPAWNADGESRKDAEPAREPPAGRSRLDASPAGQKRVLLVGTDPVLLHTRRDILERFGYPGASWLLNEAQALPPLAGILVIHICQTVDPEQAAMLARRIRALSPGTAVLYTENMRQHEPQAFDELLPPLLHPRAYARAVGALMEARPLN